MESLPYILDIEKSLKMAEITKREKEILELLQQGYNTEEVAKELGIIRQSVSRSLWNIVDKIRRELKESV